MNINRVFTRRDKNGTPHWRSKSSEPKPDKPRPLSSNTSSGIFSLFKPVDKSLDKRIDKVDAKKIQSIKQRLHDKDIKDFDEPQIEYALQTKYAEGDVDRAIEILELFQQSVEGRVIRYDSKVHMLGAENRGNVTCFLDSLLFAMFARLGSFEPMLYSHFDDEPRRRLSTLIRLWVNMLRTGKLIQTDITKHLQDALKDCGWAEAADGCQQDTSEAFSFITATLELPLLTLEVDLFHAGKTDEKDDHKFINERLLEVAVPPDRGEGTSVRLEDCLEEHFNARVEVSRQRERRNTLQRMGSNGSTTSGMTSVDRIMSGPALQNEADVPKDEDEQEGVVEHVEDVPIIREPIPTHQIEERSVLPVVNELPGRDISDDEIVNSQTVEVEKADKTESIPKSEDASEPASIDTPGVTLTGVGDSKQDLIQNSVDARPTTPNVQSPMTLFDSPSSATPTNVRRRSTSFIRRYTVTQDEPGEPSTMGDTASTHSSVRKGSIRKEVLMPAWQFFRIIPWYTNQVPKNDSQVFTHFEKTRPVLGICLKRYAMTNKGEPIRQNTSIDIPLSIALPTFIQDDRASDEGSLFGNFNLVLQSMVCHRGNSVHAGHYISLIRGSYPKKDEDTGDDASPPEYSTEQWIKFDDLAQERVAYVDIEQAMKEEMPYLLFYQVRPIYPDLPDLPETLPSPSPPPYHDAGIKTVIQESTPITPNNQFPDSSTGYFDSSTSTLDEPAKSRVSFSDDVHDGRKSLTLLDSERRGSLTFTDASVTSNHAISQPVTPLEESTSSRLSRAASMFGRKSASKSRSTSHADENRTGGSTWGSRLSLNLMTKTSKEPLLDRSKSSGDSGAISSSNDRTVIEAVEMFLGRDKQSAETVDTDVDTIVPGSNGSSGVGRSLSKKGKKEKEKERLKNSQPTSVNSGAEKFYHVHHHGHHHSHGHGSKEKGKTEGSAEKEDRECAIM